VNGLIVTPGTTPAKGTIRVEDDRIVAVGDAAAQPGDTVDARARWSRRVWSTLACSPSTSPPSISAASPAPR
jgi:hypothetical protein